MYLLGFWDKNGQRNNNKNWLRIIRPQKIVKSPRKMAKSPRKIVKSPRKMVKSLRKFEWIWVEGLTDSVWSRCRFSLQHLNLFCSIRPNHLLRTNHWTPRLCWNCGQVDVSRDVEFGELAVVLLHCWICCRKKPNRPRFSNSLDSSAMIKLKTTNCSQRKKKGQIENSWESKLWLNFGFGEI